VEAGNPVKEGASDMGIIKNRDFPVFFVIMDQAAAGRRNHKSVERDFEG
jgi:hypothetical protein